MPYVHITLIAGRGENYARSVGDAVNRAVIESLDFPEDDRFQVIHEVPDYALQLQQRRGERIMMHLVMRAGRGEAQKRAFYHDVTRRLAQNPGIDPANVVICFTENRDVDWSFGGGKASFLEGTLPF